MTSLRIYREAKNGLQVFKIHLNLILAYSMHQGVNAKGFLALSNNEAVRTVLHSSFNLLNFN